MAELEDENKHLKAENAKLECAYFSYKNMVRDIVAEYDSAVDAAARMLTEMKRSRINTRKKFMKHNKATINKKRRRIILSDSETEYYSPAELSF